MKWNKRDIEIPTDMGKYVKYSHEHKNLIWIKTTRKNSRAVIGEVCGCLHRCGIHKFSFRSVLIHSIDVIFFLEHGYRSNHVVTINEKSDCSIENLRELTDQEIEAKKLKMLSCSKCLKTKKPKYFFRDNRLIERGHSYTCIVCTKQRKHENKIDKVAYQEKPRPEVLAYFKSIGVTLTSKDSMALSNDFIFQYDDKHATHNEV